MQQLRLHPVSDMHCDLLSYLSEDESRTPFDEQSNASLLQMGSGGVVLQVMALFTNNKPSASQDLQKQARAFLRLLQNHEDVVELCTHERMAECEKAKKIIILPSLENAAGLGLPDAHIRTVLEEADRLKKLLGPIAYISLTWDGENRFGGGVGTEIGLKKDGRVLLEWMNENNIPLDVSHGSDYLIDDIINHIDKLGWTLPILASHSNFRKQTNMQRNLSDDVAKEIIARSGVIGLNFFCHFSGGKNAKDLLEHIRYGIDSLHGKDSLCLGADFFSAIDFSYIKQKYQSERCFYPELANSSCYPWLWQRCQDILHLSEDVCKKLFYQNAISFLQKSLLKQIRSHAS